MTGSIGTLLFATVEKAVEVARSTVEANALFGSNPLTGAKEYRACERG